MKMTEAQARAYVKDQMEDYLRQNGYNPRKPMRCFNPAHEDRHPSASFHAGRVKCFACGKSYDIFDLISLKTGLTGRALFQKAYEMYGVEVQPDRPEGIGRGNLPPRETPPSPKREEAETDPAKIADYLVRCAAWGQKTDYFARRGLGAETVARFGLGYDENFRQGTGGKVWKAAILPNGGSYVARNTDPAADSRSRYRKNGKARIFNREALWEKSPRPVWVVEGEFDALALEEIGASAVALGSVSNAQLFLREVENRRPAREMLIAMDSDAAGRAAAEGLEAALKPMTRDFLTLENPFPGYKDASAALTGDRDGFRALVAAAEDRKRSEAEAEKRAAGEKYFFEHSAYSHLDAFLGEISGNARTRRIPTGFEKLDAAITGLMAPGLYIFGGTSSVGKTAFVMQMADQIAAGGEDVLIFSLEMSRYELISRSLSRLTLKGALEQKLGADTALTARDITMAERYALYSDGQLLLIDGAIKAYSDQIAPRIYIREGVGDMGALQVRQCVEEHLEKTGRRPVVVVDYVQILAPYNERYTDKQNMDKAVVELKRLSRDLGVPVVAISAFNRASYREKPDFSSFRESSSLEYASDVLMAMTFAGIGQEGFDPEAARLQNPREIEIYLLKQRQGPTGLRLKYRYYPRYNYFVEL